MSGELTTLPVSGEVPRKMRRYWSEKAKRRLVELSYQPNFSIAETALRYGVNANQLHNWRRAFGAPAAATSLEPEKRTGSTMSFAPVDIIERAPRPRRASAISSAIEIELSCGARVRVGEEVVEEALRRVLSALRSGS